MRERCLWCESRNVDVHWRTSEGLKPICEFCHRERRASAKPRRTRRKPNKESRQLLFPFMTQNESGPVLSDNSQAGKV
jgi:hypothetical protein